MPTCCEVKSSQIGLHSWWTRKKNARRGDPGNAPGEKRRGHKPSVGTWCWIGGGQGALSHARKETGVACRPSKQLDYSSSSERKQCSEAHITASQSQDGSGPNWKRRKSTKVRPSRSYHKESFGNEPTRWMWEPGVGGRQPGDTDSSD
jgi:hypothetical protein